MNHPRAAHFVICGFSFAFLTISRIVLVPLFAMIGESLVPHSKWHGERELHVQRFAGQLWKAIYHSVVTIAPLWFLRNEPWWPPGLGDPKMLFVDYPLTPPVPVLREYYMFQLGYYFHALFATLMQRGRPNYVSMTIHHMSTIALVSCSFFVQNNPRLGTLVFWVHDVCDVPVCLTRLAVDLSSTAATAVFYVLLIATWVVFRLAIFPLSIIRAVSWDAIHEGWVPWPEAYAWIPLTLFLLLLLCMHFQWFFELLGMARVYFATGKALDSTETDKGSRLSSQSKVVSVSWFAPFFSLFRVPLPPLEITIKSQQHPPESSRKPRTTRTAQ